MGSYDGDWKPERQKPPLVPKILSCSVILFEK